MDRIKIFFACALGIFLGATIALQAANDSIWWIGIGMVAGGLTGYLAYEFETVLRAIPRAWHAATSWRPDKFSWKMRALATATYASLSLSCTMLLGFSLLLSSYIDGCTFYHVLTVRKNELSGAAIMTMVVVGILPMVIGVFLGGLIWLMVIIQEALDNTDRKLALGVLTFENPLAIFIYWPIKGAVFFIRKSPLIISCSPTIARQFIHGFTELLRLGIRFTKTLFLLIHSDERLFCGVVAAIGSGTGYLYGDALVCAIAGGLIGVIYYELIPKRLLHLKY